MNQSIGRTEFLFDSAGTSIHVVQKGQGETVILAHSYLWDAAMWHLQITELSKHYHVVAPSLWGHGGSGPLPEGTRDLRDLAQDHLALIDRLGISEFSLVGHSVGGMWGAELALAVPERVRSVVLIDTSLEPEPDPARQRYFAMLDAVEATRSVPDVIARQVAAMFFSPDLPARAPDMVRDFRERLAGWDADRLVDSVVPLGRMTFGRRETLTAFSRLAMPRLVIHGADDIPRPLDEGRRMADALACRLIALPGAGHMTPLEASEAVTRGLLDFLNAVYHPEPTVR